MSSDLLSRRALLHAGLRTGGLLGALGVLAGCAGNRDRGGDVGGGEAPLREGEMRLVAAKDVDHVAPSPGTETAPTVEGMIAFGQALAEASSDPMTNVVVSPASIAYAFGMVRAGAAGETARQIDQALRFPSEGLHEALNAITSQVVTTRKAPPRTSGEKREPGEKPEPPIVAMANGLFAHHEDFEVLPEFLRTVKQYYDAGVQVLDMRTPAAVDAINTWVRTQTADRIRKLFESLDPDTKLVLANAVYLKAAWAASFDANQTREEQFTRADGSTVRAPMMRRMASLPHAVLDAWQAVEIPYAGNDFAMWLVVPSQSPAAGQTAAAATSLLDPNVVRALGQVMRPGRVNLVMPRWDFATTIALDRVLPDLGMTVPFTNGAEFPGISRTKLKIGKAVHKANITVDEWGTEAAAATGITMMPVSAPVAPPVEIRADRPFAFAVVHKPTQTPLFIGQVADPTASAQ
ncbi:MAG TPA: serpin family protein [Actinopolymorphaceae bacterium]